VAQLEVYWGLLVAEEEELVVVLRWRVTLLPSGPVIVAVALPGARDTLREAVWPFGPVTVVCVLPGVCVVELLPALPFGPVMVD